MINARMSCTALTAVALAVAATSFTAPTASAYINAVTVIPGPGPIPYGTGCTYKVVILGDPGDRVVWVEDVVYVDGHRDHAAKAVFGRVDEIVSGSGKFTVDWTPDAVGEHYVGAGHNHYREGADVKVDVSRALSTGGACVAVP